MTVYYRFSGKYCEECPYCKGQRCANFMPCIECVLLHEKHNCDSRCPFNFTLVREVIRNVENDDKMCTVENADGCFFTFKYNYFDKTTSPIVAIENHYLCLNGTKCKYIFLIFRFFNIFFVAVLIFFFWAVVIYIFFIMILVSKTCFCNKPNKIKNLERQNTHRRPTALIDHVRT